jgi:predicted glycoside hydrolase/deacetylase ChbG (UPF0249 family)
VKRLIVNADDLGRTHGINTGVFEAHRLGIVTSATAMVNYESLREAAAMSREHPALGIGLHVALTGGRPALPASSIPSLVDAEGAQPSKPEGLLSPRPEEIAAEVEAQFRKFIEVFGRKPTHLDSHHHSHRRPDVFEVVRALALREGLPVRNAGGSMGAALKSAGVRTNDAFEERFFDEGVSVSNLLHILQHLPEGSTEIMCHPAHPDAELAATSSYAAVRVLELSALCEPSVKAAIARAGIQLIRFSDL